MPELNNFINLELLDNAAKKSFIESYIRKDIAFQLKKCREKKNVTQKQLSELTGMEQSNISRLESGRIMPSLDSIINIATELGYMIDINFKKL